MKGPRDTLKGPRDTLKSPRDTLKCLRETLKKILNFLIFPKKIFSLRIIISRDALNITVNRVNLKMETITGFLFPSSSFKVINLRAEEIFHFKCERNKTEKAKQFDSLMFTWASRQKHLSSWFFFHFWEFYEIRIFFFWKNSRIKIFSF